MKINAGRIIVLHPHNFLIQSHVNLLNLKILIKALCTYSGMQLFSGLMTWWHQQHLKFSHSLILSDERIRAQFNVDAPHANLPLLLNDIASGLITRKVSV